MRLFRYRPFNRRLLTTELSGKLYLWRLTSQNDPFDGRVSWNFEVSEDALFEFFIKLREGARTANPLGKSKAWISPHYGAARAHFLAASDSALRERANQCVRGGVYENPANQAWLLKTFDTMLDRVVIACFSEVRDSPVLFAHYAQGHKGCCIEYDIEAEEDLFRVEYVETFPSIHFFDDADLIVKRRLRTKHKDWSYEREWRLALYDHSVGYFSLPRIRPVSVSCGYLMPDSHKRRLARWCKYYNVNHVYSLMPNGTHYEFTRVAIGP